MPDLKNYNIDFVYTDNNQSFSTAADMTEKQAANMKRFLAYLGKEGLIQDFHVYEPKELHQTDSQAAGEIAEALNLSVEDDPGIQKFFPDQDVTRAPQEELFYIQNRGYCGNALLWWADNGHGYTVHLENAWKVPKAKAQSIVRNRPTQDTMWPVVQIDAVATRQICVERLNASLRKDS